jgi:hypothetical protein
VGPGKFEGEGALTALAHYYAAEGMADDDAGKYSLFKGPLQFGNDGSGAEEFASELGYCAACIAKALEDSRDLAGCVVFETDQGFAEFRELHTLEEYQEALTNAEELEGEDYA